MIQFGWWWWWFQPLQWWMQTKANQRKRRPASIDLYPHGPLVPCHASDLISAICCRGKLEWHRVKENQNRVAEADSNHWRNGKLSNFSQLTPDLDHSATLNGPWPLHVQLGNKSSTARTAQTASKSITMISLVARQEPTKQRQALSHINSKLYKRTIAVLS